MGILDILPMSLSALAPRTAFRNSTGKNHPLSTQQDNLMGIYEDGTVHLASRLLPVGKHPKWL